MDRHHVPPSERTPAGPSWTYYQTERAAIVDYIAANVVPGAERAAVARRRPRRRLSATAREQPGRRASPSTAPRRCGRPAPRSPSTPATFTAYYNNAGGECRQYGRVTVTDNGRQITVNFQGWDAVNQVAQVNQTDVFPR